MSVAFLFFAISALVSFTLRQTQIRMLEFTGQLRSYIRAGRPCARLVVRHVIASVAFVPGVVGILFFLFEFFNDQLLGFTVREPAAACLGQLVAQRQRSVQVLLVAWGCEFYTVIAVRTCVSMVYFPKVAPPSPGCAS